MLKKLFLSATALIFSTNIFAQSISESPVRFKNITELVYTKAVDYKNETYSFSLLNVNGLQFKQHFFAGIGVGYERGESGGNNLPVFADARYYFGKSNLKPFVNQQIGYMFHIFSREFTETFQTKGMYSANTSVGLAIPVKFAQSLDFSLGYRIMHRTKVKFTYDERSFTFHYLTFKTGLTF